MGSVGHGSNRRDEGSATAAAWVAVLLGMPAAILAVIALIGFLGDGDGETPGSSQRTEEPASGDSPRVSEQAEEGSGASQEEVPGGDAIGGCEVVVANPLATINEEPDVFSQAVTRVPAGTYRVLDIQVVTSPIDQQRWFELDVDGRSGWLRDSTFDVASKSSGCP